jgi:hypothetical protein
MKYFLTSSPKRNHSQVQLENINPAKTKHIRGYGFSVAFSTVNFSWRHTSSADFKTLGFAEPTIAL